MKGLLFIFRCQRCLSESITAEVFKSFQRHSPTVIYESTCSQCW